MDFENVLLNVGEDGIALLTIDRPAKLNALNRRTLEELHEAIRHCSSTSVRALIITGAGTKAFAAGADLSELASPNALEMSSISGDGQRVFRSLETLGVPSVAALNGIALGGGLELALACTFRVAAETAKLGMPEVRLGIIPGYGGTQRLPRLIGKARALELLLTGDTIESNEALRLGLVNHVVTEDNLIPFCRAMMARIICNAPLAVRLAMQAVETGLDGSLQQGLDFESAAFGLAASTSDWREGNKAFTGRRQARFTGN